MRTNVLLFMAMFYTLSVVVFGLIQNEDSDDGTMILIHGVLFMVAFIVFLYKIFKS